jgi:hypothetical protein
MGDVVDAGADAAMAVVGGVDCGGDHLGMCLLGAGGGAVLAVAGEVEDRPQRLLQGERLADQLLAAGIVLAGRQGGEGPGTGEQHSR